MAFTLKTLTLIGPDNGALAPRLWIYASADAIGDINNEGYFNEATRHLRVNDIIHILSGMSNGLATALHIVYVNKNTAAGVVDITDGQVIGSTDTD